MNKNNKKHKQKICRINILLVILSLLPLLAEAKDEVLSLESAIQMALTRNEQALAADQQVEAARARVVRARAFFLPNITGTGVYTRRPFEVVRTFQDQQIAVQKFNAISGVASLNMTIFDAHSIPALRAARSDRTAEQYAAAESKRKLAFEVSNAYITTLSIDRVLEASVIFRNKID